MGLIILAAILVAIVVIISGPEYLGDITGPGRSDYNVGDDEAIVPEPMNTTRNRRRRWRRKRLSRIEKAQEEASNAPDP